MAIKPLTKLTPAEYLALERRQADARHEYLDGESTMMAGAKLAHNRVVGDTFASLHALGRPDGHP